MLRKLVSALCVGAGLALMPATLARAEELTIFWAEWDPANYLQELVNDYTKETGVKVTVQASAAATSLTAILEHAGHRPAAADRVYLIDPLGNLMMCYAVDARPKGMLEDLKKLLRLSHVG